MLVRAVVFDLDGTLVDSLADLGEAMNEVLAGLALPQHPLVAYRRFVGDGIRMLVLRALPETARSEESVSSAVGRLREVYGARWDLKTRPYHEICETLRRLAGLRLSLGVLSNKPHPLTLSVVERFFAPGTFAAVLGAEAGFPRKPDPAVAIELACRLSVGAAQCCYVGDTATDMRTAQAAGMYPIGALWGFRDAEELLASGAATLAKQPSDVVSIVSRLVESA
jgi:phosphoglycolate phosphatase